MMRTMAVSTKANFFPEFEAKMRSAGLGESSIRAFQHNYESLVRGETGLIPEHSIQPVADLPRVETVTRSKTGNPQLLGRTAMVKLNGGLGTSMGLERAKSLLEVKDGLTFLDFIARHVLRLREMHRVPLRFLLMNSFSTSADTLAFLERYPALGQPGSLELMQGRVPKVDTSTFCPAVWPQNTQLEWCPPGHGDLYPSLLGSGLLDQLLGEGVEFLFVSNSDNLGATLDLDLLTYFAQSGRSFLMEVALRTASDRKGGHIARRASRLLLRESAQCPEPDQPAFQDIERHRFFNTNNLWIRLAALRDALKAHQGFIPLPLIKNLKTVDPRDSHSPPVFQLETAMGAAIEYFEDSSALVVPRTRFAPVKTTSDLLALRSDAYVVTEDWRVLLANQAKEPPPKLDLDGSHYRLVDQLDEACRDGVPSLKHCRELVVRGPVLFNSQNVFHGKVTVTNPSPTPKPLPAGEYRDQSLEL